MPSILAELRRLARGTSGGSVLGAPTTFQAALAAAASRVPPSPEVTVTARRFLPALKQLLDRTEADRIARAANPEMLAAALAGTWTRPERALLGRLHLATATAMRTHAQEPAWFAVDAGDALERLGVASVSFEAGVPTHWRAYYLASFSAAITSLRTVFPQLTLDGIDVRFRLASPADSALAMHEPKTRTLHLPVGTAAGALTHEIAHDLDRQMSLQQGRAGYWSDAVRRGGDRRARGAAARVAESLRTMTEETAGGRRAADPPERPAEIFATRVDWFVADALARQGIMSGFLSAVQDEVLTGHVLHADRLRGASRSRSLLTALEGMTVVAPFARAEREPTAYSLLQHVLRAPLERRVAREVERPMPLMRLRCGGVARDRSGLVRLAAESRARGIVRARAESIPSARRPGWARAALGEAPWSSDGATERVHAVASELLAQLSAPVLQVGVGARVDALLWSSDCEM